MRSPEDMPLYVNVPNKPFGDRMDVVYDQVDVLDLSGELNYRKSEQLSISARLDVYTYQTKVQEEAWNLPPYALSFMARYDMRSKLILKAEAQFLGKRPAYRAGGPMESSGPVELSQQVDLDGFLDLYLGIEYRYNKRLSLFLDISNLSASKYERWYKHPVQRSLLLGGATYAF
jgi:outer membrane receptor for ferrienterochelin and colicin